MSIRRAVVKTKENIVKNKAVKLYKKNFKKVS